MVTDQPGRILAVTVIGPLLLWAGINLKSSADYKDKDEALRLAEIIGTPLTIFAYIFIIYEIMWILLAEPRSIQ